MGQDDEKRPKIASLITKEQRVTIGKAQATKPTMADFFKYCCRIVI
jgi:hypothetical protein